MNYWAYDDERVKIQKFIFINIFKLYFRISDKYVFKNKKHEKN